MKLFRYFFYIKDTYLFVSPQVGDPQLFHDTASPPWNPDNIAVPHWKMIMRLNIAMNKTQYYSL